MRDVMHRLLVYGPRVGFVILLVLLGAFAALFVREAHDARASLEAQRLSREAKLTEQLQQTLSRSLDVAEARLEALETLPLGDDDGLLWVRNGVQRFPRLAGAALPGTKQEPRSPEDVLRAWPWLTKEEAAANCVRVRRELEAAGAAHDQFDAACTRGLSAERLTFEAATTTPTLFNDWYVVQRGADLRGVKVSLRELVERFQEPDETWNAALPLHLSSPHFTNALEATSRTLALKLALLTFTALLGLGAVALARLAQRRKEETLAAQRDFIATVSHELRTPLATVRLLAETLERKLPADGPARDYPRRLVAASDGLTFLVENILSFNRLESGRWSPQRAPFSFTSLESLVREDTAMIPDVNVELAFTGLDALEPLALDPALLRILVLNLTRNAIKYGQRQPVQLLISGHDEASSVVLCFRDNGPGIPLVERERVFDAFHRLAKISGSGLGLALARRIAELHGGTLRISASSPDGTTFELRLPR